MMLFSLFFHFTLAYELSDGETLVDELDPVIQSGNLYTFFYIDPSKKDLTVIVSSFSDLYDPNVYVGLDSAVSSQNYLQKSTSYGLGLVQIFNSQLAVETKYFILVECQTFCRYSITVTLHNPIFVQDGIPLSSKLDKGKSFDLQFFPDDKESTLVSINVRYSGDLQMFVTKDGKMAGPDNTLFVFNDWQGFLEFVDSFYVSKSSYFISLVANEYSTFNLLATSSKNTCVELRAGVQQLSRVERSRYKYFKIIKPGNVNQVVISLTTFDGDADLFVNLDKIPTIVDNDFSSTHIGSDTLRIFKRDFEKLEFVNGSIFIGVYGDTETRFSILASFDSDSIVKLHDGIPDEAQLNAQETRDYVFPLGSADCNFSIYLVSIHGDVDLYAKYCEKECNLAGLDFLNSDNVSKSESSSVLQSLDFQYKHENCADDSGCQMRIVVYAKINSLYYIAAVKTESPIMLLGSRPIVMSAPVAGFKSFTYILQDDSAVEVSFHLTSIFGNPDFYVSRFKVPTKESYEKCSENKGIDEDFVSFIKGEDADSLKGTFFIAVFCDFGCYYSLSVKTSVPDHNSTSLLYPGHPQRDTLFSAEGKNYRLYLFYIGSTDQNYTKVEILISDFTQDIEVWVSNDESVNQDHHKAENFQWKLNTRKNGSCLKLESIDKNFKLNNSYLVLVKCLTFASDGSCKYRIQYATNDDILMLSEDVSVNGQVSSKSYSFYSFPVHYAHEDLLISLTVHSGDPDLYISFLFENERPSKTRHDLSSKHFGSEVLTLLWEEHLKKFCSGIGSEYSHGSNHGCFVFISVYSEYSSSYSIKIHPSLNIPKYLPSDSLIFGELGLDEYDFYYSFIDSTLDVFIELQQLNGQSNLYVNLIDKASNTKSREDWTRPSEENSMMTTKNLLTTEIFLTKESLKETCHPDCIALIAVQSRSKEAVFIVEITTDEVFIVQEGKPKYSIVGEFYKYFLFKCDKDDEDIFIVLTTLTSCLPKIFVSRGEDSKPTSKNYEWTSEKTNVHISPDDPVFKGLPMKGFYMIGIVSAREACVFTLSITNQKCPIILLNQGVPQQGEVVNSQISYYAIYNSLKEDLTVTLTPTSGSPFMVASIKTDWNYEVYSDLPTSTSYYWSTQYSHDPLTLSIKSNDSSFCVECYYLVGVSAYNSSSFTVTLKSELNVRILQEGIPFKATGNNEKWDIYSFDVIENRGFFVSLSEYGDEVSFVLLKSDTQFEKSWKPLKGQYLYSVKVDSNDQDFSLGKFMIVVSSNSSSFLYSVIWYYEDSTLTLIDGWPMHYSLSSESSSEMQFKFTGSYSTFCILSAKTADFYPILITNFTNQNMSHGQVFNKFDYNGHELFTSFSLPAETCLQLKVVKYFEKDLKSGEFSLYCTSSFHPSLIQLDMMNFVSLPNHLNSWRFELNPGSCLELQVFIETCFGEVSVEVSSNWTTVEERPLVVFDEMSDGVVYGKVKTPGDKYFITVSKTTAESAAFQIIVDSLNRERLYPGNKGTVVQSQDGKMLKFQWSQVEYLNGTVFHGSSRYSLYYSHDQYLDIRTPCQLEFFANTGKVKICYNGIATEALVTGHSDDGIYFLVAHIDHHENAVVDNVLYTPVKAALKYSKSDYSTWTIIISSTIGVLAILASVLIYRKYQKVKEENIEMIKEVKNIDHTIFEESRIIPKH